jgi:hypothetical protein
MATINSSRPVAILDDGTIPIELTCVFDRACVGALVLVPTDLSGLPTQRWSAEEPGPSDLTPYRSDLRLCAGGSETLGVILPDSHRQTLRGNREIKVTVNVDLFPTLETLPTEERAQWNALIAKEMVVSGPAPAGP